MRHESPTSFAHQRPTSVLIDDAAARAWAAEIIGHDIGKGLSELRRLRAIEKLLYRAEGEIGDAMEAQLAGDDEAIIAAEETWPGLKEARAAADDIGSRFLGAFEHTWNLPVRSIADVEAKVRFAVELGDYDQDDYPVETILAQIVAFFDQGGAQQ